LDTAISAQAVRLRSADRLHAMGPLAFVVREIGTPELMQLLGSLSSAKRPMRVFDRLEPAQKWILKVNAFAGVSSGAAVYDGMI
jgi:hypothetical protein